MDTKEALEWADSREADMGDEGSADLVAMVQLAAEVKRSDIRGILRRNELCRLGGSARPDTIEACWTALEAMDIEVIGAADDVAKSRAEAKALRAKLARLVAAASAFVVESERGPLGILEYEVRKELAFAIHEAGK